MALGKKTGGRDYKKGHKNPGPGRTPLSEEIREARELTKVTLLEALNKYLNLSYTELKKISSEGNKAVSDMIVIRLLLHAAIKSDPSRINLVWDRVVGPVPKKIEGGEEGVPIKLIIEDYTQ